jgi:hypothetical protein
MQYMLGMIMGLPQRQYGRIIARQYAHVDCLAMMRGRIERVAAVNTVVIYLVFERFVEFSFVDFDKSQKYRIIAVSPTCNPNSVVQLHQI